MIEYLYRKKFNLNIVVEQRKRSSFMGRFGGGWNWCLGFELGGDSLILNLLVLMVRINWKIE